MAIDIYAPCPCGSGKKFKWCCQPIYQEIERAFDQESQGQHDSALRIMDEIAVKQPDNPEIWGRKAQLLYELGKPEESEKALEKAFELNPNYPFGHLLRGMFRQQEGEVPGALILFRRAAELYDPEARDILGQVYSFIAECELQLHRPVAARAALKIAIHNMPANEDFRNALERIFGEQSRLPKLARQDYPLLAPSVAGGGTMPAAWERALVTRDSMRLSDLVRIFDEQSREHPDDAAAWYNLGLAHAWLGNNLKAVESLDHYVQHEQDEDRTAAAWALAEVLRCAPGMEEQTDYLEHWVALPIQNGNAIMPMLQHFEKEQRLLVFKTDQNQPVIAGLITEKPPLLSGSPAHASPLQANFLIGEGVVRIWHVNVESVNRLRQEIQLLFPDACGANHKEFRHVAVFSNVLSEAVLFPVGNVSEDELTKRIRERMEYFFEDVWIQKPRLALENMTPINSAADRKLRKKLRGVIAFLEDCSTLLRGPYDFGRLRRKLGLEHGQTTGRTGGLSIADMSAAELAALKPAELADAQLDEAYRAAYKLDAEELAENFARNLVERPAEGSAGDRAPVFFFLIQKALHDGRVDDALASVEQGERFDCENNEGRRRNEYELRRAQVHVKRKDANEAWDVFGRLIERVPSDMRVRAAATEGMLSLRQADRALKFAEQGLAKARELNDGESEGHFLELLAAARRTT